MDISFTAKQISGSGRGRGLGSPTINLDLKEVPEALEEGVYAIRADGRPAVMHYGGRPTFDGSRSCEVHLLDEWTVVNCQWSVVSVDVVERLRDVKKFENKEALKEQIADDIKKTHSLLEY